MAMFFATEEFLPARPSQDRYLTRILRHFDRARQTSVQAALDAFFGTRLDAATLRLTRLHHVAAYIGDYSDESEVDDWIQHLRASAAVRGVSSGPSHIAPRHHGTPGYWMNMHAPGGELELFTCRRAGPWADLEPAEKVVRMSHFGLGVDAAEHVRPALDFGASFDGVDLLAFAPADELGHTYGHLVNRHTGHVLEIVYSAGGRLP
jgi:hypothetical protein